MPEHFHLLLTPAPDVSWEKLAQFIKGGFCFSVKHELGLAIEVWQPGPQVIAFAMPLTTPGMLSTFGKTP